MIPPVPRRSSTSWMAAFCVLAALAGPSSAQAQGDSVHTQILLGAGFSYAGGNPGDPRTLPGGGLSGHAGLRHQRQNLVFSLWGGMHNGGSARTSSPGRLRDSFNEVALLAGYAVHRSENSQVVFSAGIASVSGYRVARSPAPDLNTINVPFRTQVGVPLQVMVSAPRGGSGFGLTAHANLNPEEVFGALTVTYLIGLGGGR